MSKNKRIECADGFTMSVQANSNAYCSPRSDNAASYDEVEVGFQNFTESYSAINSVQAVIRAGNNGRSALFRVEMTIKGSLGTLWSAEDLGGFSGHRNYRTLTYTARTTYDGSNAWTLSKINNLRMKVELVYNSAGTTSFTYCYFIVDYNLPVATDNSVFFGTNF